MQKCVYFYAKGKKRSCFPLFLSFISFPPNEQNTLENLHLYFSGIPHSGQAPLILYTRGGQSSQKVVSQSILSQSCSMI